jgi:hypothetical protein
MSPSTPSPGNPRPVNPRPGTPRPIDRLKQELHSRIEALRQAAELFERAEDPDSEVGRADIEAGGDEDASVLPITPSCFAAVRLPEELKARRIIGPESREALPARPRDVSSTQCLRIGAPPSSTSEELQLGPMRASFWKKLWPGKARKLELQRRYVVGEAIFQGGTSRIYRAFDRKLSRDVAVKLVPPPLSRVVREALDVTWGLKHPSILRVEGAGDAGQGGLYLVMPLLEGTTLRKVFFARDPATHALLLAFRRACEGVAHAHAHGVIHRDLKPDNIQIEPDGRAVVLDWGLACRAGEAPGPSSSSSPLIVGTPLYMAPEQLEGRPVSPRTDVHALGTILYELVTGVNPWGETSRGRASSLRDVTYRIQNETPPPPSLLRNDVPPRLDEIILQSLSKDPARRFEDAEKLLEALEDASPM